MLLGPELFYRDQHTTALKEALKAEHGDVDTFVFDGSIASAGDVLEECRSFGLMSGFKLVIINDAELFCAAEDRRDALIRYCESPSDAATLLLRAKSLNAPKLKKAIETAGVVVPCEPPDEAKTIGWVIKRATQRHGAAMDEDAAVRLVHQHGRDLTKLDEEAKKLALAAGDDKRITRAMVHELSGGGVELNPFEIQGALLSGDPRVTLHAIVDVLESQPRDAHVPLGIAAAMAAARLHEQAATGSAGKAWGDLGFALGRIKGRVSQQDAKALLDAALKADVDNKSGIGDPRRNLEILALRFAEVTGRGQRGAQTTRPR
jgi:DNA polymerase III delta subunit